MDWETLIAQRNEWVAHNFPDGPSHQPTHGTFGVMEEIGELAHAHLKEEQQIRMNEDHVAKAQDAIGDTMIYLMGVMNYGNVIPTPNYRPALKNLLVTTPEEALLRIGHSLGALCVAAVMPRRSLQNSVNRLVFYCRRYCELRGWDFEQIVWDTWNSVKKRDWIANPDDADKKASLDLMTGECACYARGADPRVVTGLRCVHSLDHAQRLGVMNAPLAQFSDPS